MIQTDNKDNRILDLDALEGVIGGAGMGSGTKEDTTSVSCPVCGCKFSLPEGKTTGKCPDCGATVTKKC